MLLHSALLVSLLAAGQAAQMLAGGKTVVPIDDEIIAMSMRGINSQLNAVSNENAHYVVTQILKAEKQVVAGVLYHLEVLVQESTCTKSQTPHTEVSAESCPPVEHGKQKVCKLKIWQKPWENNFEEIENVGCKTFSGPAALHEQVPEEQRGQWRRYLKFISDYDKGHLLEDKAAALRKFAVFRANLDAIDTMNRLEQGSATYGVTQFADLTPAEFESIYLTRAWADTGYPTRVASAGLAPGESMPDDFDWRNHSAVTAVKNQGMCGSCWAFSTTGNIEGAWAIKKHQLLSLSEQELVDCDKLDQGCNGGLPSNAYKEIMRLGGLELESDYPYTGHDDKCTFDRSKVKVYINDSVKISQNETEMAAWLYKNGPISIGINAEMMQFYWGGIAHPWSWLCNPEKLDHGVLIVGYGVDKAKNEPFWIIKNSWGASWGEHGYYRIFKGAGVCGVNRMATSAIVD